MFNLLPQKNMKSTNALMQTPSVTCSQLVLFPRDSQPPTYLEDFFGFVLIYRQYLPQLSAM